MNDTDGHCVGIQVDAAVEWVLLLVKFHHASPGLGVKRFQQHFFSLWFQTSATDEFSDIDLIGETASPGEAMMSIKYQSGEPEPRNRADSEWNISSRGSVIADVRHQISIRKRSS